MSKNLTRGEKALILATYVVSQGIQRTDLPKLRIVLEELGIKYLKEDAALRQLVNDCCVEDPNEHRLLTLREITDLIATLKAQHVTRCRASNGDIIEAFMSVGGSEDTSGDVSADMLKMRLSAVKLGIDIDQLIAEVDEDGSGKIEFGEFETLMTNAAACASAARTDTQDMQVLDPFCMFVRLGGDPDLPETALLAKAVILENIGNTGIDDEEQELYRYFTQHAPVDMFTLADFCQYVVDRIDLGYEGIRETPSSEMDGEGSLKAMRRNTSAEEPDLKMLSRGNSLLRPHASSAALAMPRRCIFPRGLTHCLALDYSVLKRFEGTFSGHRGLGRTARHVLWAVSKVTRLLARHRVHCRACSNQSRGNPTTDELRMSLDGLLAGTETAGISTCERLQALHEALASFGSQPDGSLRLGSSVFLRQSVRPKKRPKGDIGSRLNRVVDAAVMLRDGRDKTRNNYMRGVNPDDSVLVRRRETTPNKKPPWRGGGRNGLEQIHAPLEKFESPKRYRSPPRTAHSSPSKATPTRGRAATSRYIPQPDVNSIAERVFYSTVNMEQPPSPRARGSRPSSTAFVATPSLPAVTSNGHQIYSAGVPGSAWMSSGVRLPQLS